MEATEVSLLDAWRVAEARTFFRNVWPMYVHELASFDSDFYRLAPDGKWLPDIANDWVSAQTPDANLHHSSVDATSGPFQRTHVIVANTQPVGFVCVGLPPFKYMPGNVDAFVAEFFVVNPFRGRGIAARALQRLLPLYPGRWQLCAIHDNLRAIRFWRKTLPTLPIHDLCESPAHGEVRFSFVTE